MYLMSYYAGSSAFGALIGLAFQGGGWSAAAGSIAALYVVGAGLAATLSR
jgi:hypothetical protein